MHLTLDEYASLELYASLEVRSPTSQALYFVLEAIRGKDPVIEDFYCKICSDREKQIVKCPHGNDAIDCDACYKESDHAYDAAREDRK